jgi:ABC-type branched-subunit amino acid transport system ATPase component
VTVLDIMGLTKRFMGLVALDNVNFRIEQGELVALIGPNGSGKTTLFNCITGFLQADEGRILYRDRDITRMPAHSIALLGLSRTFQSDGLSQADALGQPPARNSAASGRESGRALRAVQESEAG